MQRWPMANEDWVPTAKLRFVKREGAMILEQWFTQDVPGYMRKSAEGEWRAVVTEVEPAP